jgi:hypothetical protein
MIFVTSGAVNGKAMRIRAVCLALGTALSFPATGAMAATVEPPVAIRYAPLSIGAFSEFGMLQGGRFGAGGAFRDEWVDNFGAFMTQSASVDDRWFFNVGIGGIFQFQKPEEINAEWGGTQTRNFFAGPTVADVEYELRPGSDKSWRVGLGLFPYKYNRDAANLGEYLFRSGPYPTYLLTGGYSFVNSASMQLQGLKSRFTAGNFSADVFLLTETTMPPLYDLSLAAVTRYRALDGLLDLGAGVNFKRIVPIRPSRTKVQSPDNAWFRGPDGVNYSGDDVYYMNASDFYAARLNEAATAADSAYYLPRAQDAKARLDSVRAWINPASPGYIAPDYEYYTQSGVVLNATVALDLKKLLPASALLGPEDLRLYAEAALLGVQNYPVFYENRMDRVPIMVGINLPGFRILDLIALQGEYFPTPHANSYKSSIESNRATPELIPSSDRLISDRNYGDRFSRDNVAWSLLLRKQVTRGLTFSAQAARDHARMVSHAFYAGPGLAPNAIFYAADRNNWYWMAQLSFGI